MRKIFLNITAKNFTTDFWGRCHFHIKGEQADTFHDIVKNGTESEVHQFLISETKISTFLETYHYEFTELSKSLSCLDYEIDEYMIEDHGEFAYLIKFDPNELYDVVVKKESLTEDEIVTIFRVEDDTHNGYYFSNLLPSREVKGNQKTPSEDGEISLVFSPQLKATKTDYSEKWVFGFPTLKKLESWIGFEDTTIILDKISVYKIPSKYLLKGQLQVAFNKEYATYEGRYIQ